MKIAIPIENGRLHEHFGGCRHFALVEVDPEERLVQHAEIVPAPEHQPGLFPRWLSEKGVSVVITGGIGRRALAGFAHHGITVRAGRADASVEELVAAHLNGRLTEMSEGCEHHEHEHKHEHEHEHGSHHHGGRRGGQHHHAEDSK